MNLSKADFLKMLSAQKRVINSLCAVYYPTLEDQKDARQDITLQLWKAWPSFKQQSQLSTWVYRIGLNTLLNKKRMENRRPTSNSLSQLQEHALQAMAYPDDDLQLLKQIIELLGDMEKAIVVLHLEGYQNKEIAQMLDLSASNVGTRMNRIKTKLKQYHDRSTHATQ